MGRKNKGKRKKSDNSVNNDSVCKAGKFTGVEGAGSEDISVSTILNWTNSVLYGDDYNADESVIVLENSIETVAENIAKIPLNYSTPTHALKKMEQSTVVQSHQNELSKHEQIITKVSTNDDIMTYLKELGQTLRIVKAKVDTLDRLEAKVDSFEKECAKLWNYIYNHSKAVDDRLKGVEEQSDTVGSLLGELSSKVSKLEEEKCAMNEEIIYLKSQALRNNLIFANIPESPSGNEENCENVLREFLHDKLKLAQDTVDQLQFDRVHRIGPRTSDSNRRILARFTMLKDKEMVRKEKRVLDGTPFHLHEQFPKEIADKRRCLWPKMKEALDANKRAWMSYDTLYIDGSPVKCTSE